MRSCQMRLLVINLLMSRPWVMALVLLILAPSSKQAQAWSPSLSCSTAGTSARYHQPALSVPPFATTTTTSTSTSSRSTTTTIGQHQRVSSSTSCSGSALHYGPNSSSSSEDNSDKEASSTSGSMSLEERMKVVRSLQNSFYQQPQPPSSSSSSSPGSSTTCTSSLELFSQLDAETGTIHRLPLWRVPWHEVPGRQNVLHVHDPTYTSMFEAILRQKKQPPTNTMEEDGNDENDVDEDDASAAATTTTNTFWVGHLYSPKEKSTSLLKPWWQQQQEEDNNDAAAAPGTLGTLLRITDYCRLQDGRLLLLVQAMERFVVHRVHQTLPYSIVDAVVLPDTEELQHAVPVSVTSTTTTGGEEEKATAAAPAAQRAAAVQQSWFHWHRYEYESQMALPLPRRSETQEYLRFDQIVGSQLTAVVPFAPYSSSFANPTSIQQLAAQAAAAVVSRPPLPSMSKTAAALSSSPQLPFDNSNGSSSSSDEPQPIFYAGDLDGTDSSLIAADCDEGNDSSSSSALATSLEARLWKAGIFRHPTPSASAMACFLPDDCTADELEVRLWLALNEFLKTPTRKQQQQQSVSPILFGLLPPDGARRTNTAAPEDSDSSSSIGSRSSSTTGKEEEEAGPTKQTLATKKRRTNNATIKWPRDFILQGIGQAILAQQQAKAAAAATMDPHHQSGYTGPPRYVRVSSHYPAHRRQKRLSYCAAALLERRVDSVDDLRQQLLAIPSTRQRLAFVLRLVTEELQEVPRTNK